MLKADLPGLGEDDVRIEVRDNVLTIAGERSADIEDKQNGYYRVERAYGSFSRSFSWPVSYSTSRSAGSLFGAGTP